MIGYIDSAAVVMLIESNWSEFVDYCGGEEDAEVSLKSLKEDCGME